MVSLDHNRVPRAEGQILSWEDGEDPTAQVVLQSQSFVHHLESKAIIIIIKSWTVLPSKTGSPQRRMMKSRWSLERRKCESWAGLTSESPTIYSCSSSSLLFDRMYHYHDRTFWIVLIIIMMIIVTERNSGRSKRCEFPVKPIWKCKTMMKIQEKIMVITWFNMTMI